MPELNNNIEHLKEFEFARSSDEAPSLLPTKDTIENSTATQTLLAYRCPFCRELPLLCKGYKSRVGDNRVVYCKTRGCAIYKFAISLRIWNTREPYLVTFIGSNPNSNLIGGVRKEEKEDIYDRSYGQS